MLSKTQQHIKDNLHNFINGYLSNEFSKEEMNNLIELSFLYNHMRTEEDCIHFEYEGKGITLRGIAELTNASKEFAKETIIKTITTSETFKAAFKQFIRDNKLSNILDK